MSENKKEKEVEETIRIWNYEDLFDDEEEMWLSDVKLFQGDCYSRAKNK